MYIFLRCGLRSRSNTKKWKLVGSRSWFDLLVTTKTVQFRQSNNQKWSNSSLFTIILPHKSLVGSLTACFPTWLSLRVGSGFGIIQRSDPDHTAGSSVSQPRDHGRTVRIQIWSNLLLIVTGTEIRQLPDHVYARKILYDWLKKLIFAQITMKGSHFLKGVRHEIFDFKFFSWIRVPQAPKYSIGAFLNFFENSQRYSRINVYHWCQRHWW